VADHFWFAAPATHAEITILSPSFPSPP
jgi:hypothetical protein